MERRDAVLISCIYLCAALEQCLEAVGSEVARKHCKVERAHADGSSGRVRVDPRV